MDHGFLQDLALVMSVAGVVTILFHVVKQPVVLGYILAGLIVGPYTPSIPLSVKDHHTIQIMSELGVILLMFSLGLHFSLRKLAQVGVTAVIAALMEIILMVVTGYGIGRMFGWGMMDSLFLGAILSISSTTIITKALGELKLTKERFAELIFGILIVEDILAIAMIALLSGIAATGTLEVTEVAKTLGKLSIFLVGTLVFGLLCVPMLLRFVARFKSNEMLLVTALALCFGMSLLAITMGYSVALGAFLIGAIVAEARERGRIETLIEPVRDMFSAVFFVAIGMMIQPTMIVTYFVPIIIISLVVVVGKVVSCSIGTFLAGNDGRTSMRVGMGLAQIGEFSFIIAALGLSLKVTSEFLYPIAVAVSVITTLLTPYLIRWSDATVAICSKVVPLRIVRLFGKYSDGVARLGQTQGKSAFSKTVVKIVDKMLAQPHAEVHTNSLEELPQILRQAQLETVEIQSGSISCGRLIRELQLRSRTGASVVGIERGTESVVNPGPDEELLAGDRVLLIGRRDHLTIATELLTEKPVSEPVIEVESLNNPVDVIGPSGKT